MDPLHDAASRGDLNQVKNLLGQNPKLSAIDKKDDYDRTALFFAVRNKHREVADYLLGLKASARAECSCCKTTALSKAAENGDVVLVENLIKKGANLTQKNLNLDTPISLARRNGHEAVAIKLKSIKEYKIEELSEAALSELTDFVSKSDGLSKLCGGTEEDIRSYLKPKADLAAKAALNLAQGGAGPEITHNLTFLALYDLIILIDDSWSMKFDEAGKRLETLEKVVKAVIKMYTSVRCEDTVTTDNQSGTSNGVLAVRFINSNSKFNNVVPGDFEKLKLRSRNFSGTTKIGTALKKKIIAQFVPEDGELKNPLLIMFITDGAVEGERKGLLEDTIRDCAKKVEEKCGNRFIAFQFSRIGTDEGAHFFLQALDRHREVGKYVAVETAGFGFDEILNVRSDKRRVRVISTLTKAIKKDPDEDNDEGSDGDGNDDNDDNDD